MNKRKTWLFIALVLAAIGGCLAWLVKYPPMPDHATNATADSNSSSGSSYTPGCNGPLTVLGQDAGAIANDDAPQDDGIEADADFPPRVVIRCVDPEGVPVEGMKLEYWGGQVRVDIRRGEATTDAGGLATFTLDGHGKVHFESVDEHWILKAELTSNTKHVKDFTAQACVNLSVWIMLEDGEPWVGGADVRCAGFRKYLRFDGQKEQGLARVPSGAGLAFNCFESMLGVDEQTINVTADEIFEGQRLVLTLKRNPNSKKGVIRLDLTNYAGTISGISVTSPAFGGMTAGGFPDFSDVPQAIKLSNPLTPGDYVVKIEGKPGWLSSFVQVETGKITDVTVFLYVPATVTVTVADESGEPLSGAAFLAGVNRYVGFDAPGGIPAGAARTDSTGRATLSNLPPGEQRLLVEAQGYEPHELQLNLTEGESRVEGPIYLKAAQGRIELTLKGMRPGQKYTVMILQPGGTAISMIRNTEQADLVFDKLPLRKYVVAVIAGKGGDAASGQADLTQDAPESQLELDVSNLTEANPNDG